MANSSTTTHDLSWNPVYNVY